MPSTHGRRSDIPSTLPDTWRNWFTRRRERVDALISSHVNTLKADAGAGSRLIEAVDYSWSAGGKRVRPVLTLECCRVCGGDDSLAEPAALAVEAIHAFSLIHDDLPAMDDDDLRRGRPTNHKVFGEALAILAGDWLVAHAFRLLANSPNAPAVQRMTATLAEGTQGMAVGQAADIEGERVSCDAELVKFIHLHKTARLIETSCRLGALAAGATSDSEQALGLFGRHLGLAFQIQDDLLDCTSATGRLGKTVGKDVAASKQTYPAAFGIESSRKMALGEAEQALECLRDFGPEADPLRGFAEFVVLREH